MDELEQSGGEGGRGHLKAQVVRERLSEEVTSKLSLGLRKSQSLEVLEAEEIASAKSLRLEPDLQIQETERRSWSRV